MKKILDDTKSEHEEINLKNLIKRNDTLRNKVSLYDWIYLSFLELLFGMDLLESFHLSCSYTDKKEKGRPLQLNRFIPNKFMMNIFKSEVRKLIYYKYFLRYKTLEPEEFPTEGENSINCTRYTFHVNKVLITQISSLKTIYMLVWFLINLMIDFIVYLFTNDMTFVLISVVIIEGIRRLFRI